MTKAEDDARWEEPASPDAIAAKIYAVVKAVEQPGCPEDAGTGHFGLHMGIGTENIGISNRGRFLQVTIYRSSGAGLIGGQREPVTCPTCGHTKHPPIYTHPGYPRGVHDKRMRALADKFGVKVREHWNGLNNHDGISIVLNYPCPPSLLAAIERGPTSAVSYSEWAKRVTEGDAS
jgi:hypothetical protein